MTFLDGFLSVFSAYEFGAGMAKVALIAAATVLAFLLLRWLERRER